MELTGRALNVGVEENEDFTGGRLCAHHSRPDQTLAFPGMQDLDHAPELLHIGLQRALEMIYTNRK